MIKLFKNSASASLFAGAALVLAGPLGVYAASCPFRAAKGEGTEEICAVAVKAEKPAGACCAVEGCACKAKCPKVKAECPKGDGENVKAECTKEQGCVKAACPKAKEACAAGKEAVEVKAQETCPVMGGKINRKLYVDHDGKRVYVCCKGCIAPVKKDAAKFIKALEADGVTLEHVKRTKI